MNIDTISEMRTRLNEVAEIVAGGRSLSDACDQLGITPRAYRRWAEIVKFTHMNKTAENYRKSWNKDNPMAKVLVIEDERLARLTIRRILERAGYEVVEAADGVEGYNTMSEQGADLVITDIIMPEKEGITTLSELKRDFPDVPAIAISGGGRERNIDLLMLAKQFGARSVLAKPFTQGQLLDAVATVLPERAAAAYA